MSVNILLEGFEIDAPWLYGELKSYIKPNHSVAVIAFSFRSTFLMTHSSSRIMTRVPGEYPGIQPPPK